MFLCLLHGYRGVCAVAVAVAVAHLLVDGRRVEQEGDLLHGLPVAADLPGHVVAPHHQGGGGRRVGVGHQHRRDALRADRKGRGVSDVRARIPASNDEDVL